MQETKLKNILEAEAAFMQDYWDFRKKHHEGGNWESLYEDMKTISGKYKNLYTDLILAVCIADIEMRCTGKTIHLKHMIEVIREEYGSKD